MKHVVSLGGNLGLLAGFEDPAGHLLLILQQGQRGETQAFRGRTTEPIFHVIRV